MRSANGHKLGELRDVGRPNVVSRDERRRCICHSIERAAREGSGKKRRTQRQLPLPNFAFPASEFEAGFRPTNRTSPSGLRNVMGADITNAFAYLTQRVAPCSIPGRRGSKSQDRVLTQIFQTVSPLHRLLSSRLERYDKMAPASNPQMRIKLRNAFVRRVSREQTCRAGWTVLNRSVRISHLMRKPRYNRSIVRDERDRYMTDGNHEHEADDRL